MTLLSRVEKLLSCMRVRGGFCGADRYSKQDLQVWSQHKVRTLVLWRASGTGRSPRWVRKIVSFRPWCGPVEEKEQEYVNQYPVVLNIECSS
jgi:predicted metal-dependent hydrolase